MFAAEGRSADLFGSGLWQTRNQSGQGYDQRWPVCTLSAALHKHNNNINLNFSFDHFDQVNSPGKNGMKLLYKKWHQNQQKKMTFDTCWRKRRCLKKDPVPVVMSISFVNPVVALWMASRLRWTTLDGIGNSWPIHETNKFVFSPWSWWK